MAPLIISLASAFSWGVSDFLGGLTSRRMPVLGVLAVSQPAGLVMIGLLILLFGADPISADKIAIATLAGAAALGGSGRSTSSTWSPTGSPRIHGSTR